LKTTLEAIVGPAGDLDIHQQAQPLFEGQVGIVGALQLLLERSSETGKAELGQFVE
jgi:hypothetical protein